MGAVLMYKWNSFQNDILGLEKIVCKKLSLVVGRGLSLKKNKILELDIMQIK